MQEEWLTLEEVAQKLRLKHDTMRKWIKTGKLRAQKVGRRWLVHISEIDRHLPRPPQPPPPT